MIFTTRQFSIFPFVPKRKEKSLKSNFLQSYSSVFYTSPDFEARKKSQKKNENGPIIEKRKTFIWFKWKFYIRNLFIFPAKWQNKLFPFVFFFDKIFLSISHQTYPKAKKKIPNFCRWKLYFLSHIHSTSATKQWRWKWNLLLVPFFLFFFFSFFPFPPKS